MIAVSLDAKMVYVCDCIPISNLTLSGVALFFSGKKVPPPPPPPQNPRGPYAYVLYHDEQTQFFLRNRKFI